MVNIKIGGGLLIGQFDLFYSLEHDKQKHIIDAAMEEFAEKGFKRASTNTIVEKAGISKGMLFYYFGSKEELFDFLCDYTLEFGKSQYVQKFAALSDENKTGDFLERYALLSEIKHAVISEFPIVIKFWESLYLPENEEYFKKHMQTAMELRDGVRKNLYGDIDYSLFREDVEPQNIVKYIIWLMDSFETDVTAKVKSGRLKTQDNDSLSDEWKRFYLFTDELRKIFYK